MLAFLATPDIIASIFDGIGPLSYSITWIWVFSTFSEALLINTSYGVLINPTVSGICGKKFTYCNGWEPVGKYKPSGVNPSYEPLKPLLVTGLYSNPNPLNVGSFTAILNEVYEALSWTNNFPSNPYSSVTAGIPELDSSTLKLNVGLLANVFWLLIILPLPSSFLSFNTKPNGAK